MSAILKSDNLKLLDDKFDETYKLFLFNPTMFKLFPKSGNMHKMDFKQRVRFFLLLMHGYRVYVLGDKEDNVVACAVFANGKTYRYPFASENDLICGPYYVMPEYRRKGIATKLLKLVLVKKENPNKLIINRSDFLNSLRRVSIFANQSTFQVRLLCTEKELIISSEDIENSSDAKEKIACEYEGDQMEIGFNAKFLMDMVNNIDTENVMMELAHPSRAGILFPVNDEEDLKENILMLVMPVMLNAN